MASDKLSILEQLHDSSPLFLEQNEVLNPDSDVISKVSDLLKTGHTEALIEVTDAQDAIIKYPYHMNEILSIRAGPGSGKTFTLVARIAQLMQDGIKPNEILVLSMANRSVDALRNSLRRLVGTEKEQLVAFSTFHSFCGSLLDSNRSPDQQRPLIANNKTFLNFAEFFRRKLVKLKGESIGGFVTARQMADFLPLIFSNRVSADDIAQRYKINPAYLRNVISYLKSYGLSVYDDIIGDTISLLNRSADAFRAAPDPETARACLLSDVANYKVVIVDEFQDIYPILLDAIKAIVNYPTLTTSEKSKHLTISGDPLQSIYDFLGSSATYMANINSIFPHMTVIEKGLDESFRCTQDILNAAVGVVSKQPLGDNDNRLKSLRPDTHSMKPILFSSENPDDENRYVADEIARLLCLLGGAILPLDIAVLGSTNKQIEDFQRVLSDRVGIMSHKARSTNNWPNTELNVFRLISGVISGRSHASFDLMGVLQVLDQRTGSTQRTTKLFIDSLERSDSYDSPNFFETYLRGQLQLIKNGVKGAKLSKIYHDCQEHLKILEEFFNKVDFERDLIAKSHSTSPLSYGPAELVKCFERMSTLWPIAQFLKMSSCDSPAAIEEAFRSLNITIHHVFKLFATYDDPRSTNFLNFFLENYDCEIPTIAGNSVEISTIHSAKGLEFPIVFILGMQNRRVSVLASWDHCLSTTDALNNGTSSEFGNLTSRLLYVAMTRARTLLYLGTHFKFNSSLRVVGAHFTAALPSPLLIGHIEETIHRLTNRNPPAMQATNETEASPRIIMQDVMRTGPIHQKPFLSSFCSDLDRPKPTAEKILHGMQTYSTFSSYHLLQQSRLFSTRPYASKSCQRSTIMHGYLKCLVCQIGKVVNTLPCR